MKLLFASSNNDKVKEVKKYLNNFEILTPNDLNLEKFNVIEDGESLEENAYKKASTLYKITNKPTFADDTGLFVKSLGNTPGVRSHRYASENPTYEENRKKLLEEMENKADRSAYFKTVICFIDQYGKDHYFEGRLDGQITLKEAGSLDFGYDQIFLPKGSSKTLGEMSVGEKNEISHRSKSLENFKEYLG